MKTNEEIQSAIIELEPEDLAKLLDWILEKDEADTIAALVEAVYLGTQLSAQLRCCGRCGIGNRIASASTFPNRVWEREARRLRRSGGHRLPLQSYTLVSAACFDFRPRESTLCV